MQIGMSNQMSFPENLIIITDQRAVEVTFKVNTIFDMEVTAISVQYRPVSPATQTINCDYFDDFANGIIPLNAKCMDGVTMVNVIVYFGTGSSEECEQCFEPNDDSVDTVFFSYEIRCDSPCEPDETETSGPTAAPTSGPTSGPTAGPTAGPTSGPTSEPTARPISGPTVGPVAPTTLPTPTCPYPPLASSECPSDVVQMLNVSTELPFIPIKIVTQDDETVTFTISNPFGEDVSSVYYQYATATVGDTRCYSESPFVSCPEPIEVTAHCLTGPAKSLAIVDIWFVDPGVIDKRDNMTIPECCEPEDPHMSIPTVHYTFKVYCETKCAQPTGTPNQRTLFGQEEIASRSAGEFQLVARDDGISFDQNKEDTIAKGHFCSSVDYPCGDKGKMVNVCHYSTKDGYQTYCVPETDSDVIAYVPKDYCGPCVGGYHSSTSRN
jgi:hypothetical protein